MGLSSTASVGPTHCRRGQRRPGGFQGPFTPGHPGGTALNEIGEHYYGRHAPRRGKGLNIDVTLSREETRHGATVPLRRNAWSTCPDCAGDPRRQDNGWCSLCRGTGLVPKRVQEHQVGFPAGLREGQRVRLRGLGERGANGGENGDLYVTVHIVP
ncbi:DnaJ C-terminal domain-containing protein [Kitasatospora sp. NPDC001527]|uniref:DnaJ C-terminal domain-containing protein n=1 Tax=Kitasatospora sp. NPDC001527 TaxID=3154519 RepID=UPI00332A63B7